MADAAVVHVEVLPLASGEDVVRLRKATREQAVAAGFSLVDQTKIVTAASELGRNTIQYGGGGEVCIQSMQNGTKRGVRLQFIDSGPGIADIRQALTPGWTSGGGLGLGLSGARSLCDEFDLQSEPGKGTTVTITRWKPF